MNKDIIKQIIIENQERIPELHVFSRDYVFEPEGNYVITGQRRTGKTYLMYRMMQDMIGEGKSKEHFLYLNMEDERLVDIQASGLDLIVQSFRELYAHEPVFFFDEIQNVSGWQKFIRRLADSNHRVIVTGSNAVMLSSEIASSLGGRFLVKEVEALSFLEYLGFAGIEVGKNLQYQSQRFEVARLFEEYFQFGGFPELHKFQNKLDYLRMIYQRVFLGDIIERHQLRNPAALKLLVKKLAESTMDEVSFNRLKNIIQSVGIKVGTATLIEYLSYLEEAYLLREMEDAAKKISERETKKKYYFRDHGLLALFLPDPASFQLETLVFNSLIRQYPGKLSYIRNAYEVDFFIPGKSLIQVAYSLGNDETRRREIQSLVKASKNYPAEELLIITRAENEIIKTDDLRIKVIDIVSWILGN